MTRLRLLIRRMQASGAVRLGMRSTCMCHCAAACVNSAWTLAPLRNRQWPPGASKRRGEGQEFRQRGQGAGGDERRRGEAGRFDAGSMDADRGAGDAGGLAQERGLALVGFDQIERNAGGEGQDQAGEAGAGAQVDGAVRERLHQRDELEQIGDMAVPEERLVAPGDEIDGPVPADQERREAFERRPVFHVKHRSMPNRCFT